MVVNTAHPPTFDPKILAVQSKRHMMPSQTVTRPHLVEGRSIRITWALTSLNFGTLLAIRRCRGITTLTPGSS